MKRRQRIAIVAGDMSQPRFFQLFESLSEKYDVHLYAMNGAQLSRYRPMGLKLRLFEPSADMPGYLHGLEDELANADLIFAVETSQLASFQAVRAARKYQVPFAVVCNEFHPYFYEKFANIRAIQYDICGKSELFIATSRMSAACLKLEQVPEASIRIMAPVVDTTAFSSVAERRKKFRNYIGIDLDDFVVLFHHQLEPYNRPAQLLEALSLLSKKEGIAQRRLRVIFAGNGAEAMDLKYRAYDAGLGKSALFLHQDPEPFLNDLYNASDFYFMPRPLRMDFHEPLPLTMLEAMATGSIPIVGVGGVADEYAGDGSGRYRDDLHQDIAAALQAFLLDPGLLVTTRKKARERVIALHSADAVKSSLFAAVDALLHAPATLGSPLASRNRQNITTLIDGIGKELERSNPRQALVGVEEALLFDVQNTNQKSQIYRLKADAHYALAEYEAATESYAESLRYDDRNHLSLRGLGFVSWQGHANEEALVYFRRALALRDDDAQTMYGIGLVFRRIGLVDDALFWLEKCVVRHNCPPSVFIALAQTCAQLTNYAAGIQLIERVLDVVGDQHTLLMTLGQLYLQQGKTAEGHAILQRVFGTAGQAV